MLPTTLLVRTRLLPRINPRHDRGPAVLAIKQVVDLLGQVLARQLAVLRARARLLAFDDDAGGEVLELDGGRGFVLGMLVVGGREKGTGNGGGCLGG